MSERFEPSHPEQSPAPKVSMPITPEIRPGDAESGAESAEDKRLEESLNQIRAQLAYDIRTGEPIRGTDERKIDRSLSNYESTSESTVHKSATDPRLLASTSLLSYIQARQLEHGYEQDQGADEDALRLTRSLNEMRTQAHRHAAITLADLRPDLFESTDQAGRYIDELVSNYAPKDIAQRLYDLALNKKS